MKDYHEFKWSKESKFNDVIYSINLEEYAIENDKGEIEATMYTPVP